jgi:hypothetical protein
MIEERGRRGTGTGGFVARGSVGWVLGPFSRVCWRLFVLETVAAVVVVVETVDDVLYLNPKPNRNL